VVAATGTLPVRLFAVPPSRADPDGARAATELAADPVDHRDECALRVGLFQISPRVRQIALVFNHAAVDYYAAEIVLRDLRLLLLRGAVPMPAAWQLVDVAAHEQHECSRSDHAARYWPEHLTPVPGVRCSRSPSGAGSAPPPCF